MCVRHAYNPAGYIEWSVGLANAYLHNPTYVPYTAVYPPMKRDISMYLVQKLIAELEERNAPYRVAWWNATPSTNEGPLRIGFRPLEFYEL